ncbi:MAG: TrkA family potassium uptake protein [Bacteroidales bacterium]|nr:TrkA family potassium uptake protein [Bacteroidales bacterium]
MNYLVIGLGNFGGSLAIQLTKLGHEVIGLDKRMENVELYKDEITQTICADCTDFHVTRDLPLKEADAVIICIGENEGENIMATALMKQLNVKRIISRAVSPLHETVLQSMEIEEIVHPELDSAERLARNLHYQDFIDSFELAGDFTIVKAKVPGKYAGKSLKELDLRRSHHITVLTTITTIRKRNILGMQRNVQEVKEVAHADTVLDKDDIVVVYGQINDISQFLG